MSLNKQMYEEIKEELDSDEHEHVLNKKDDPIYLKDYVEKFNAQDMEKVAEYLANMKDNAEKVSTSIGAIIFSPALVIFMMTLSEYGLNEDFAALTGVLGMLGLIGWSVFTFIKSGLNRKKREALLNDVNINGEIEDYVKGLDKNYKKVFDRKLSLGILCIMFCYVPLIIGAIISFDEMLMVSMVNVLLALIGMGVYLIVSASMTKASFKRVLKNNYFEKVRKDPEAKVFSAIFPAVYWPLISTVYVITSLVSHAWDTTWLIWPLSSAIYFAIFRIINHILSRN